MVLKEANVRQQIADFLSSDRSHISFVPEYEQNHFFLIVASSRRVEIPELLRQQSDIVREITESSPRSRFTIFFDNKFEANDILLTFLSFNPEFEKMYENGRLEFRSSEHAKKMWAHDLGQSVHTITGGSEFIRGYIKGAERYKPSPEYEVPTVQIPVSFEGGDLATAIVNGEKTVIIGPQSVNNTRLYYERAGYKISNDEIKEILLHAFNADKVVLLASEGEEYVRPARIFHIDQAVFFPKDNIAVIVDPESIDDEKTRYALNLYVKHLEKEGFQIVKIPSSYEHVNLYQAYANSIPIKDKDGTVKIIMPSFGDQELEGRIKEILEKNGMAVIFVNDITYKSQGNLHCITGAFARVFEDSNKVVPVKIG